MKFLVDANILSEPTKASPDQKVVDWLNANESSLAVDTIVLGELYLGVLVLPAGRQRAALERWFDELARTIACLAWDAAVSRRWAKLVAELRRKGKAIPILDGMIAATALEHGLTVATRNVRDFRHAGVAVVNPFENQ